MSSDAPLKMTPRVLRSRRGRVNVHNLNVKESSTLPSHDGDETNLSSAASPAEPDHVPSIDLTAPERTKSKRDTSKDVLCARGAAAQTITNPGNLLFYRLCEERYEEFSKLDSADRGDPRRRKIFCEIIDVIEATGGVFRSQTGGVLKPITAIEKVRDRLRQIGKPKLRPPTGDFGEDDVVFTRGAANHLYPGNAKWRTLLDSYCFKYFSYLVNEDGTISDCPDPRLPRANFLKQDSKGKFVKGNMDGMHQTRAPNQNEIIAETIQIVHDRGGKFRNEKLKELSRETVVEKTISRFKDCKKDMLTGKLSASGSGNDGFIDGEEGSADVAANNTAGAPLSRAEIFHQRLGGFTSVRAIEAYKGPGTKLKPPSRKRVMGPPKRGRAKRTRHNDSDGSDDDDHNDDDSISFQSELLDSDNDGELSSDEDEETCLDDEDDDLEMSPKHIRSQQQAQEREERTKRRESGPVQQPEQTEEKKQARSTKRKKRMRKTSEEEEYNSPGEENHPLSEYELYRLEKIKRNMAKLAELGLL